MAKAVSLKVESTLYEATEQLLGQLGVSRNAYINQAIAHYNQWHERKLLAKRLREESRLVQAESHAILSEFERFSEFPP